MFSFFPPTATRYTFLWRRLSGKEQVLVSQTWQLAGRERNSSTLQAALPQFHVSQTTHLVTGHCEAKDYKSTPLHTGSLSKVQGPSCYPLARKQDTSSLPTSPQKLKPPVLVSFTKARHEAFLSLRRVVSLLPVQCPNWSLLGSFPNPPHLQTASSPNTLGIWDPFSGQSSCWWGQKNPSHGRWNSPSKNTVVCDHSILQGIFSTQGSNLGLLHCRQILYHLSQQESPIYLYQSINYIEETPWLLAHVLPFLQFSKGWRYNCTSLSSHHHNDKKTLAFFF